MKHSVQKEILAEDKVIETAIEYVRTGSNSNLLDAVYILIKLREENKTK